MEADTESLRIQVAVCILSGKLDVLVRLGGLHSQSPLGAVPDLGKIVDWVSAHRPDTRSACVPDDQVGLATPGSAESVLDNAVGCKYDYACGVCGTQVGGKTDSDSSEFRRVASASRRPSPPSSGRPS